MSSRGGDQDSGLAVATTLKRQDLHPISPMILAILRRTIHSGLPAASGREFWRIKAPSCPPGQNAIFRLVRVQGGVPSPDLPYLQSESP